MESYQLEQRNAFDLIRPRLPELRSRLPVELASQIADYLAFRSETEDFLQTYFGRICSADCYLNQRSACCSKDGIITFFADVVINLLHSSDKDRDVLALRLSRPHTGPKCIYLGAQGCLWTIKPIVCQMFLCDDAQNKVFDKFPQAAETWRRLNQRRNDFTWPDKPVLFEAIETLYLEAGCTSPLMYLHNSPGLLRVKRQAGLIQ